MNKLTGRAKSNAPHHAHALRFTPIALAAMAFTLPAYAQTAATNAEQAKDDSSNQLQIITVTARKRAEPLQSVPVSVVNLSKEVLQTQGITDVISVATFTPGLYMRQAAANETALVIGQRGQFQSDTLSTVESSIGIYVDDMYWARAYGLNANLLDVEGVQTLKGPQGTLFGRNTTGGAMLITTADPSTSRFTGRLEGTIGRFNERVGTAVLNVPVKEDTLAIRIAATSSQRNGYASNTLTGAPIANRDIRQARLKVLLIPTADVSLMVSAEKVKQSIDGPAWFTIAAPSAAGQNLLRTRAAAQGFDIGAYTANFSANPDAGALNTSPIDNSAVGLNLDTSTYMMRLLIESPIGQMKMIAGTRKVASQARRDLDGSPIQLHFTATDVNVKQNSVEAQLTGQSNDKRWDYATGITWFTEAGLDKSLTYTLGNPGALYSGDIDNKSVGIYGQTNFHFTEALSATGGLRYSRDDKGINIANGNSAGGWAYKNCGATAIAGQDGILATMTNGCRVSRTDGFHDLSYTFGLDYKLNPDQLVYGKFGKGYRAGGQNLRATSTQQFVPFKPELVHELELGFKGEMFARRLRFNAAVFANRVTQAQRSTIVPLLTGVGTTTIFGNAAKVKNVGFEVDMKALVAQGFTISAGAAYQDPKYVTYSDAAGDHSGDRFIGIPKFQYTVGSDYEYGVGLGKLKLHADYAWRDKVAGDAFNNPANAEYGLILNSTTLPAGGELGARVALAMPNGVELAVWGRNLANNRDVTAQLFVLSLGEILGQARAPRTYGFTASYKF